MSFSFIRTSVPGNNAAGLNNTTMPDHRYSNQLIHESSPYLLQHAHNPVNWYPWGEEALQKAVSENRPILVSIGYAACHWCHVMERESFEDEATATIMNANFVNIKIDREERPDLDHIYMDAVQAMTGSGGWPLNVFLTPDGKPFYGGTYFPPQRAYNRPSWKETLHSVAQAFRERRHEIDAQAENLTSHIRDSNAFGTTAPGEPGNDFFTTDQVNAMADHLLKQADTEWGGFGRAPKFPQTFSIQYLLRYSKMQQQREPERAAAARKQALLSLDKMIEGGIYDQVGGGFARYATDTEWLAPHFEKMLYDNALLVIVLSEAFQLTGIERYREVIHETMEFVQRELMHARFGFYAALDADSEGEEGRFYVWQQEEINTLLGKDAAVFSACYDVSAGGNWEHTNILRLKKPLEEFAKDHGIAEETLRQLLADCRQKLLARRSSRVRPLTDDKNILGWNALMNTACSRAFAATGREAYRELATKNMQFLLEAFRTGTSPGFYHTWKNDQARYPAFLDDYACLLEALLALQEITPGTEWLEKAMPVAEYVLEVFSEEGTGFFFYTPDFQKDVIVRKKEVYDGAMPSGNAVMAKVLWQLSLLTGGNARSAEWRTRSQGMIGALGKAIVKYPGSFGVWACLLQEICFGTSELAVVGEGAGDLHREILAAYIPHRVLQVSASSREGWPLLAGKTDVRKPAIYLCRNNTCQAPVFSAKELISLINSAENG